MIGASPCVESLPQSVGKILSQHVTLEVEGIDRLYLNAYVPKLQHERGVVWFFKNRGQRVVSEVIMAPISKAFVAAIERFTNTRQVPLITFAKDQRKDDVAAEYRKAFTHQEGVMFVGKAQEKVGTTAP